MVSYEYPYNDNNEKLVRDDQGDTLVIQQGRERVGEENVGEGSKKIEGKTH